MTDRHAVSINTAADLYDVSRDMIRKAVSARQLPAKKIGNGIRINVDDLREWFNSLPDASPAGGEAS